MNKTDSSLKVYNVLDVMSQVTVKATNGDLNKLRKKQALKQSKHLVWSTAEKDKETGKNFAEILVTDDLQEKARLMRQQRKIRR